MKMKNRLLLSLLAIAMLFGLSACGSGGTMNIARLPISDETVMGITGDITDTSVQKEAIYFKARSARDKMYQQMYAQSGFDVEFEMKEVSPGVFVQAMKKVAFKEAPRFDQPLPDGPSEHPVWKLANNVVDKGTNALLWYTGITEGVSLLKDGIGAAQPKYYGNYNPQTAEPYIVRPEVVNPVVVK